MNEERFCPVSYKALISFLQVPLARHMRGKGSYMSFYENDTPHQGHAEIINILRTKNCIPIKRNASNEFKSKAPLLAPLAGLLSPEVRK